MGQCESGVRGSTCGRRWSLTAHGDVEEVEPEANVTCHKSTWSLSCQSSSSDSLSCKPRHGPIGILGAGLRGGPSKG